MSTVIRIDNLHLSYGETVLFDGAAVDLAARDRVGVIGRNGAGKSTLCRLILGLEAPDDGAIARVARLRLGYLEQHSPFERNERVLPFLMRHSGAEEWKCARVAARFQLQSDLLEAEVASLPGGYQTRCKLVSMLLRDPNFLVLDEPTNYLDLRTLLLLERFLADFNGGYLVVSHDREFLKRTCDKTLEVERGRLFLFPGDVEAYLEYREEQLEQTLRHNRNIEAQRRHLQRFVDRYRVRASTASRAQSKLKQMERLKTIEVEHPMKTARIKIPPIEPKKGIALRCEDLAIGYADRDVATGIHLEIERGERVAVLGDNGQGKTTLLRTMAGELPPLAGGYRWGHELRAGYYAQHVFTALDDDLDIKTYLSRQAASDLVEQDVLDMAGSFLFSGHDAEKPISVLSGGERARVYLAGLLLGRAPVLLLDEPTNHLDFETVEALGNALRNHAGTMFFVSHDRTFVKLVATSIVEVKDGAVTLYPGDYDAYVAFTEREVDREIAAAANSERPANTGKSAEEPRARTTDYHQRKELRSRLGRLTRGVAEAERNVAAHERERESLHRHFLENPLDPAPEKQARIRELEELIAREEAEWTRLAEELEEVRAALGEP